MSDSLMSSFSFFDQDDDEEGFVETTFSHSDFSLPEFYLSSPGTPILLLSLLPSLFASPTLLAIAVQPEHSLSDKRQSVGERLSNCVMLLRSK
jgi:hypothetical protein